ncbi:ubiquitin domain containing protein [Trichuris trichiura]|uniref:Ubiquitin domain containing protein n=1 Tax=Trichuris trichiura TaxID=36087 RepID=A0A077Z1W3_TRITR|nr:ubiquitin domain containing protein [Trichuris trichiura]
MLVFVLQGHLPTYTLHLNQMERCFQAPLLVNFRQNFASDLEEGKVVRLIYRGQLLRDDSRSLASYGLFDNCVVHCHISHVPYTAVGEPTGGAASSVDRNSDYRGAMASISFDIGNLIYVLFGVKFAFLWAALYLYPDYFDSTSLLSLLFCSLVFLVFCLSAGRRRNSERQSPRVTVTAIASTNATAS